VISKFGRALPSVNTFPSCSINLPNLHRASLGSPEPSCLRGLFFAGKTCFGLGKFKTMRGLRMILSVVIGLFAGLMLAFRSFKTINFAILKH